MTISRTTLCLVAAAGLLAACSKPAANQAAAGSAAPAAASGPELTITEADLPKLKPGQWETSVSDENGGPPTVSRHCENGQTMKPQGLGKACSAFTFKRTVTGGIVIDATCGQNGVVSTMHMSVRGDYNASLTGDSQVSLSVPGQPTRTYNTHTESHYLGPCPPGEGD